ncbi:MAG: MBL fold metallo-hydrolase [Bacteroidetes bacterium]|nr:MBL fold metallo-hydrolase [Bacteroidota bacterium]MCL5737741.1 MBL fold metallo-hydrolase [Bacteroidota bacterium]
MKIKFWGVRGSIATPGESTVRYGGNTSCTELHLDDGSLIILDAGTGIRNLGNELANSGEKVQACILITHPHWDHIQGFPFFRPAFMAGNQITIVGPEAKGVALDKLIAEQMNKIYFPVRLSELQAKIKFMPLKEDTIEVYGAKVQTIFVNHPGFTLGYKITCNNKTLVYISDDEPYSRESARLFTNSEPEVLKLFENYPGNPNQRIVDFVKGADVLIHDSTYTPEQYQEHIGWGHSHYLFTLQLAEEAKVKNVFLFHYDPSLDDDTIDEIIGKCEREMKRKKYSLKLCAAKEGLEFQF